MPCTVGIKSIRMRAFRIGETKKIHGIKTRSIVYWKRISNDSEPHEKKHEIIVNDDHSVYTVVFAEITTITDVIIGKAL